MALVNLQVIDSETRHVVASVTVNDELVTTEGLQAFTEAVCAVAVARSGEAHHVGLQDTSKAWSSLKMRADQNYAHNVGVKPRGKCPRCGREYPLDKNGLISKHGKKYGTRTAKRCSGTGMKPLSAKAVQPQVADHG